MLLNITNAVRIRMVTGTTVVPISSIIGTPVVPIETIMGTTVHLCIIYIGKAYRRAALEVCSWWMLIKLKAKCKSQTYFGFLLSQCTSNMIHFLIELRPGL